MSYPIAEQTARQLWFAFKSQSVKGTPESGGGGTLLPFTTNSSLIQEFADVQSNVSRSDLLTQLGDYGQGSVPLAFESEEILGAYDILDAATMRTTFQVAATISEAEVGTVTDVTGRVITFSGTAAITHFKVGDLIRPTTGLDADDLGKNFVVTAVTASTITLDVAPATTGTVAEFDITRFRYAIDGETDCALTIEQHFRNLDSSFVAEGGRFSGFTVSGEPNAQIRRSWEGRARQLISYTGAAAPRLTDPTASTGLSISMANVSLIVGGQRIGALSAFSLNHSRPNFLPPTSSVVPEDIGLGPARVTGSIRILKSDNLREIEFLDRLRQFGIGFLIEEPVTSGPRPARLYYMSNCRWTGARPSQAGQDAFVTVELPFEAGVDLRGGAFRRSILTIGNTIAA